ncbi:hypothetical protein IHC92_01595 [Photobacterium damselae subsp. damselae]|uniref:DUF6701 domain-containing protein n=1 Tax=Photobacterium damselae TaxID=38293 RepID=UPI001F45BDAC|nr:DUF6701 domain-containing protein [Photobacterium damselae]UKA21687.1 hypothetical protein IHC92_01595 [Photobacterium damselae subsp. damselae]
MRIYLLIFAILSCLFLRTAMASTSQQFEFGTISGPCVDHSCVINFKNSYDDPLIFLMPSFADGHWNDAPSTLRVISASGGVGGKARIRQYFAPYNHNELTLLDPGQCNGANWCLTKQPMTNISYFVIENGADINLGSKGRIIAKSILTNKYLRYKQTASKNNSEEINTKDLIGKNQLENFGVIVESQAVNNIPEQLPPNGIFENQYVIDKILDYPFYIKENYTNRWYTPAVIKNSNSFYLALDRGETVINGDYYNNYNYYQKVGYLLVTGAGQYKGLLFSLGHGSTPNTLGQNKDYKGFKNVTLPSERQCGEVTEVPHSSQFKGLPFILASKNSRNGSDGGIFRLCRLKQESRNSDDIEVSFVTDEDLNEPRRGKTNESCGGQDCIERRHADEKFGFMAFQQAVDSETCELFPGPAQSWDKYDSELEGNHNVSIIGAPVINGSYHLGFTEIDNESGGNNQFCNGKECFPAQGYTHLYAKKAILDTWPGVDDGYFSLSSISSSKKEYWFQTLSLEGNKVAKFPNGTIIHTRDLSVGSNSWLSSQSENPDDLIIYVHGESGPWKRDFIDMTKGAQVHALIYSERDLKMSYGNGNNETTRLVGSITAPDIEMVGKKNGNNNLRSEIIGQSACFESEPNYSLTITPKIKTNTLCDDQPIAFNVQASDGSSSNYTGKIRVTISSRFGGQWAENANFTNAIKFSGNTSFDLDVANNQALFWLRANGAEKIMVSGSIDRMEGAVPIGEYSFIPGGFKITPQSANIIAGKPFSATITAVACPADNLAKVITNYNGFKPLKFSTQYDQPATPAYEENKDGSLDRNRPIKVEIMNHQGATDLANIQFTNGKSEELTLRYREAGALKWQVTDPTCTPDSCPFIENNQSKQAKKLRQALSQGLIGSMSINARPWTFAICPLTFNGKNQYRLANGNISSGEGYASAGKPFDVLLKPLVWQSSKSSRTDIINVSNQNYCGYSVTNNFLATGAPSINGKLSIHYQLDTPKDGNKGNFKSGQMTVRSDLKGLLITGNTWDEVGSIWYQVGLDDYLGMNIDKSQRHIGRFYPAYFALTNPEVTYANSSFTYLQQPFKAGFKLGAYNRSGDLVHNYLSFADDLKATFKVNSGNYVESGYTPLDSRLKRCGNISDPECLSKIDIAQKLSWPNFTKSALSQIDWPLAPYVVMRDQVRNHPITTEPDGPFFDWQLRIEQTTKPDGVTWQLGVKSNSQGVLVGSNDLRYGRMVLQDAAGDIRGPVAIPLRVEYWNGAAFETNTDDSSSHFDGQNYCRQILYPQPDKGNSPSTSGIGNVDQGVASNEKLVAYPDVSAIEPFKQQVRFWQRLSNSTKPTDAAISCFGSTSLQPWLSYNWRKQGDEDPSAVVTFGVYQGNKRIIYRAEAGVASSNYQ